MRFLCELVEVDDNHTHLIQHLHNRTFHSVIPNDENREADGLLLRESFLDRTGRKGSSSLPKGQCTVLEMLIALAIRMEFQLSGRSDAISVSECFWLFLTNLDVNWVDNDAYVEPGAIEDLDSKIDVFCYRKCDKRGHGGLFPLKRSKVDQRRVELWYQMMAYLLENWDF